MIKILSIFFIYILPLFATIENLKVGVYENRPLSYMDNHIQPSGLFIDILKDLTKDNIKNIYYIQCTFPKCIKMLENGEIDILGPIAYSQKRAKKLLFLNNSILLNMGVVYIRKESNIYNMLDLKNMKIGYLKDDIYLQTFMDEMKTLKINIKLFEFNSYTDIFKALENGKIDAGIGGRFLYYTMYEKFPNIKPSDIIFNPVNITFALNKNKKELKTFLDKKLQNYKLNPNSNYYKYTDLYLQIERGHPYFRWSAIILLIMLISISFLIVLNNELKRRIRKATKKVILSKKLLNQTLQNERYLSKILNTVKNVNQLLLDDYDFDDKLSIICKEIVKNELYALCWIGFIEDKDIILKGSSEPKPYYLDESFKVNLDENSIYSKGSVGQCFREKKTSIISVEDKNFIPWKDKAKLLRLRYVLSSPIFVHNELKAIIVVYSKAENGFTKKEIELIEELAGDIGLWIGFEKLQEEKHKSYEQIIYSLNKAIEARDPYTAGHDYRVAEYSEKIANALHVKEEDIKILQEASKIHDIGKIKTPDNILLKPAALTKVEYEIIKEHPVTGYEILTNISFLKKEAEVILYHHERFDGSGYPKGLKGDEIPFLSQILSIADTFDAMTTNRIYKKAKTKDKALAELETLKNIWFSEKITDAAISVFKKVEIDNNIAQTPLNTLEEERFAYFFKDPNTSCYNQNFLKHIFIENQQTSYKYLYTISLKNFTIFNKKYGWEEGDNFLKEFATILHEMTNTNKIFRLKGDDFIILSKTDLYLDKKILLDNPIFIDNILDLEISKIDIKTLTSVEDIKRIIRNL